MTVLRLDDWTDREIEILRAGFVKGDTFLSISRTLSRVCKTIRSRSAVGAKAQRIGLVSKMQRKMTPKPPVPSPLRPRSQGTLPIPGLNPVDLARVTFAELEPHHCRFPVGDPTLGFCGQDREPGISYCAEHAQRCFNAPYVHTRVPAEGIPQIRETTS